MLQTNLLGRQFNRENAIGPKKVYTLVAAFVSNGRLELIGEDDEGRLYSSSIAEVKLIKTPRRIAKHLAW